MKPISVWGWLGGHGAQRPIGKLARMPGLHPYSFSKDISSFLMTTESQDVGLTSHPKADGFGHSMCLGHTHRSSSLRGDSFHCRTCRSGSIHFSLWIHSRASYCSQIHSRDRSSNWVRSRDCSSPWVHSRDRSSTWVHSRDRSSPWALSRTHTNPWVRFRACSIPRVHSRSCFSPCVCSSSPRGGKFQQRHSCRVLCFPCQLFFTMDTIYELSLCPDASDMWYVTSDIVPFLNILYLLKLLLLLLLPRGWLPL